MGHRVTHDPNDPKFPHGTTRGYRRGCPCRRCKKAKSIASSRSRTAKENGQVLQHTLVPAALVIAHVESLKAAVPGASNRAICRAAGIGPTAINPQMRGQNPSIEARRAATILAVTPEAVAAQLEQFPTRPQVARVRKLQAAGWSLAWQIKTGRSPMLWLFDPDHTWVSKETVANVDALYRITGGRLATPENSGQTPRAIHLAKCSARSLGWFPPACYDEETGELLPWALDLEPGMAAVLNYMKMSEHDKALARFAIVNRVIEDGVTKEEAARGWGVTHAAVDGWLRRNLHLRFEGVKDDSGKWHTVVAPGQAEQLKMFRHAHALARDPNCTDAKAVWRWLEASYDVMGTTVALPPADAAEALDEAA